MVSPYLQVLALTARRLFFVLAHRRFVDLEDGEQSGDRFGFEGYEILETDVRTLDALEHVSQTKWAAK